MHYAVSLLDRLLDDEPELSVEQPYSRAEELRRIRAGFRRDLESLLNTRRICVSPPAALAQLKTTLPNYGVEDFVGSPLATLQQRGDFAAALESTIRDFEPRFSSVKVTILKGRGPSERVLRMHITAAARIGPSGTEPVMFAMMLDPSIRKFAVEDATDG